MDRRRFLRTVGGVGAVSAVAGCLGIFGGSSPPPRQSEVFNTVAVDGGTLQVQLESQPVVESRADLSATEVSGRLDGALDLAGVTNALSALSPVGVASAAKGRGGGGGKGATGRGRGGASSAPRGRNGRAKYHGGAYADDWREEHEQEVTMYRAAVSTVGVARIGDKFDTGEDLPGVEKVAWDETYDVSAGEQVTYTVSRPGWYRTGSKLTAKGDSHDFGWEFVDSKLASDGSGGYEVETQWKLSPRL